VPTEWIPLIDAPARLAKEWHISESIADEIVRAVLIDGEVSARGIASSPYRYETIPRIIPKADWKYLRLGPLFLLNWSQIEIDWSGLLEHGRNHVPGSITPPAHDDEYESNGAQKTKPAPDAAKGRGRRGPAPGSVDRYGQSDRELFPEIERIMREKQITVSAAASELADNNKVDGVGSAKSRAKRLATRYQKWKLAETR
jgi:hypothetical protein